MAIFSRRTLQKLINENSSFLTNGQTRKHVTELNRMADNLELAYEWEIVLINAFGKIGKIRHEKDFGSKKPDIYFEAFNDPAANFLADITTVSDKGINEQNPVNILRDMMGAKLRTHGLKPHLFRLWVGSKPSQTYKGGPKVQLLLPGRARLSDLILGQGFDCFIKKVHQDSTKFNSYKVRTDEIDIEISYDPTQKYDHSGHRKFTSIYSLTKNTVYQALQRKAGQLRKTGFKGPLGIFVCDGDCSFFQEINTQGTSYNVDEVIRYFLSEYKEIVFVATFTTRREKEPDWLTVDKNLFLTFVRLYGGTNFTRAKLDLLKIIQNAREKIPQPERDPRNAINYLKFRKNRMPESGSSNWGGIGLKGGQKAFTVKISARGILDMLAGKVSYAKFCKDHRFKTADLQSGDILNPFETALKNGQLIDEITIEKSELHDDDWITFSLKGPDPAISKFRMPPVNKQ